MTRRWFQSFLCAVAIGCSAMTCSQKQNTTTFNTLYSLEHTTVAAYDGYLSAVLNGQAATNDVPKISHAFNDFQAAMIVAVDTTAGGTNALAPSNLILQSSSLLNLITTATKGGH